MARQDSRHRGPEESRDANSLIASTAKMDWPCYIRMSDARLPKKVFYGELQEGKALSWPEDTVQRHPQSLSGGFRNTHRSVQSGLHLGTKSREIFIR